MTDYRVILEDNAQLDMESIFCYSLSFTKNEPLSEEILDNLFERMDSLRIFPKRNPIIDNRINFKELRKLIVDEYVVLYYIDEKDRIVHIYRVMNQKQRG